MKKEYLVIFFNTKEIITWEKMRSDLKGKGEKNLIAEQHKFIPANERGEYI